MKSGTFINYQLAEAILLLNEHLKDKDFPETFNKEFKELKDKWKNDIIPATGTKIPELFSMQELDVKQLLTYAKEIREYDTYSIENSAGMQNITKISSDGSFEFVFSKLDEIANLARINGKKIIIDSAVIHGDHFPETFKNLSKEKISEIIKAYITELTTKYGDVIERIDVLNAIFERKEVKGKNEMAVEDFWIDKFGPNYGEIIINICKDASAKKDIPLCWNEFYITNMNCPDRKNRFLSTVGKIKNLDVIGIQDAFQDTADLKYTANALKEIEDVCLLTDKKFAITELSCILSKKTVDELYDKLNKEPLNINGTIKNVEDRVNNVIEGVTYYSSNSSCCTSVEGRLSKELDYYSHRPELTGFNKRTNTVINTVGNNWKKIVDKRKSEQPKVVNNTVEKPKAI